MAAVPDAPIAGASGAGPALVDDVPGTGASLATTSRALVLNASYEPLCLVPARRAVVLVLRSKAEIVHSNCDLIRAERLRISRPSVIRLVQYVRIPNRRRAALSRRAVFLRDANECQYCGSRAENIDHVLPRSRGGGHTWENVVACCRRCNGAKEDRTPQEAGMRLRSRPAPPSDHTWIAAGAGMLHPDWTEYLTLRWVA
jgi:5-methylcytosine-specific restriction endonuclease McrA